MRYIHVPTRTALSNGDYVAPDGTRYPYAILSYQSTADLSAIGVARVVDGTPPAFDPETEAREVAPIEDWTVDAGVATKTYIVRDLTQQELDDRQAQRDEQVLEAAIRELPSKMARVEAAADKIEARTPTIVEAIDTLVPQVNGASNVSQIKTAVLELLAALRAYHVDA